MKTMFAALALAIGTASIIVSSQAQVDSTQGSAANDDAPRYDAMGRLLVPADYREWVFLSAGIDMTYGEAPAVRTAHVFDNVFAPRAAYAAFKKTGTWPEKTMLILEIRSGSSKGSINTAGHFQTANVVALEAHVKDSARFKGGWGFFDFEGGQPATLIPQTADCYSCHLAHAASDTTFLQFYPTLLPVARTRGTLSAAYLQAEAKR